MSKGAADSKDLRAAMALVCETVADVIGLIRLRVVNTDTVRQAETDLRRMAQRVLRADDGAPDG